MRFFVFVSVIGLILSGCAAQGPSKIPACEGSLVKNCSPVIYFLPDSADVSPYGKQRLDWSVEKMKRWPEKKMFITGHSYEWGGNDYNMELSERRAQMVGRYFVERGIEPERIQTRYLGNTAPVCLTSECQNLNRRVTVEIYTP